jgi:hypothetical protein
VWLWLTNLTLLMGVELDAAIEFRRADEARRHPNGVMPSERSALS